MAVGVSSHSSSSSSQNERQQLELEIADKKDPTDAQSGILRSECKAVGMSDWLCGLEFVKAKLKDIRVEQEFLMPIRLLAL